MTRERISYAKLIILNKELTYQIRFSLKAKHLQLRITPNNLLELIIPKRYSLKAGEKFILNKLGWIKKHQDSLLQDNSKKEYFFLGKKLIIVQSFNLFLKRHKLKFSNNILFIESPPDTKITFEELYYFYLRKAAKEYFGKRAKYFSERFGFSFKNIKIRDQSTRWGSCSSRGNLSFNFKLLQFKKKVIDYVIVHELCHTREMNHSKKFWKLVESICPDYMILKKELKSFK